MKHELLTRYQIGKTQGKQIPSEISNLQDELGHLLTLEFEDVSGISNVPISEKDKELLNTYRKLFIWDESYTCETKCSVYLNDAYINLYPSTRKELLQYAKEQLLPEVDEDTLTEQYQLEDLDPDIDDISVINTFIRVRNLVPMEVQTND